MEEKVTAIKPQDLRKNNPFSKSTQVIISKPDLLQQQGAESRNQRVQAKIIQESGRQQDIPPLIHKTFQKENHLKNFVDNWQMLKSLGFPVPLTLRQIQGRNELLVTDLTKGGKYFVFSTNEMTHDKLDPTTIVHDLKSIHQQMINIARLADSKGFIIGPDAYFFIVDKTTKQVRVVLGDLGAGITRWTSDSGFAPDESFQQAKWLFENYFLKQPTKDNIMQKIFKLFRK